MKLFYRPKKALCAIILSFCLLTFLASETNAAAGIYKTINFQGKLQDNNGLNVANGNYSVVFTLYDASSGGSNLWDETQTVAVADGVFQVNLGSVDTTIAAVDFNSDSIYLGVKVGADAEMTPRIRFSAVPYAFNAEKVSGLTVTNTTGTFTLTNAKTFAVANTLSFSGTDSTAFTFPTGSGTVVTLDSTAILTNKTLTAPRFADGGFIADVSGNELLIFDSNASAVNELTLANAATGNAVVISATGETNVGLTINSKAAGALTLDSGTTGLVNLGTGNNAKTINLGTGTAGNILNIGTNNTISDTITIGSVLDNVAITSDSWSVTDAGALTVASCSGCGSGGASYFAESGGLLSTVNSTLDFSVGGTSTASSKFAVLNVAGGTPTASISAGLGGAGSLYLTAAGSLITTSMQNLTLGGATTGDIVLNPRSAGQIGSVKVDGTIKLSDVDDFTSQVGEIAYRSGGAGNGFLRFTAQGTNNIAFDFQDCCNYVLRIGTTNNPVDARYGYAVNGTTVFDSSRNISNIGTTMTAAAGLAIATTTTGVLSLDSGTTGAINLGTGNNAKTINLGTGTAGNIFNIGTNNTISDTITIGSALDNIAIISDSWSVTDTGALTVVSCSGCGGGSQTPWTGNIDGDNFSLLDMGTNITSRNGLTFGTGSSGALTLTPNGTGDTIVSGDADSNLQVTFGAAPGVDMQEISNAGFGTTTDGVDGLYINFVQADDAGVDTNYGLNIGLTAASDDAGEVLGAINISVTGQTANNRERGITIGSGFDEDIYFASASAQIRIQDGGEIEFTDGTYGGAQHNDLPLGRLKEYFATANYGVFEAQGFINLDGSFFMDNFVSNRLVQTADNTNQTGRFGDSMMWSLDELGTGGTATNATMGCSVTQNNVATQNTYNINGNLEVSFETISNTNGTNLTGPACQVYMGASTLTGTNLPANAFLQVANKFVVYYKFRPSAQYTSTSSQKYMWFGVNNHTAPWQGMPTVTHTNKGGMWIANVTNTGSNAAANTVWGGVVQYGTNRTTVGCTGANISTSAYALGRIEARATNDVRFFLDSDVSNGVSLSECGSVTSNIPTVQMRPAMNMGNFTSFTSTAALWTVYVDLFSFVQDDPRDEQVDGLNSSSSSEENISSAPNPIVGADIAENYIMDGDYEIGDVVVLGDIPGRAKRAARQNDRKLLGAISESPGLVMGENGHYNSQPIALSGRVPVKVNNNGGKIRKGDPITSSDVPGVGQRAKNPGKIIGTAMEDLASEEGKIMVAINVGYYIGDEVDTALIEQPDEISLLPEGDVAVLGDATQSAGLTSIATGSAQIKDNKSEKENIYSVKDALKIGSNLLLKGISINVMGEDLQLQPLRQGGVNIMDGLVVFTAEGVTFAGKTIFETEVIFKGIATFASDAVFNGTVKFSKAPEFNKDSAGFATIYKGERFVDVVFEKEYKSAPVVNISIQLQKLNDEKMAELKDSGYCVLTDTISTCEEKIASEILNDNFKYAVASRTSQGFMVIINKEAPLDITFSWQAISVANATTSVSESSSNTKKPTSTVISEKKAEEDRENDNKTDIGDVAGASTDNSQEDSVISTMEQPDLLEQASSQSAIIKGGP